jgi:hypothetical protein
MAGTLIHLTCITRRREGVAALVAPQATASMAGRCLVNEERRLGLDVGLSLDLYQTADGDSGYAYGNGDGGSGGNASSDLTVSDTAASYLLYANLLYADVHASGGGGRCSAEGQGAIIRAHQHASGAKRG